MNKNLETDQLKAAAQAVKSAALAEQRAKLAQLERAAVTGAEPAKVLALRANIAKARA